MLLTTEQSNSKTENLDLMSGREIVSVINHEDYKVALSVAKVMPVLIKSADIIADKLSHGGRLFIFGAGTSGRLGVMNAVGITEKYDLPNGMIRGIIAGGDKALRFSVENSEDNREQAIKDFKALKPTAKDVVWGISAGGGAPYILQVLETAQKLGLYTIGYSSNENAKLKPFSNTFINPVVGPEVLTGSSRMKSGSAQEMTLLAVLEAAVVQMGKTKTKKKRTSEILKTILSSFKTAAPTVKMCIPKITKAVQMIADSLNNGGRVFYFGNGTMGRLGVLDASECWPTFGVDHGVVNGYILGGDAALRKLFAYTAKESVSSAKKDFVCAKKLPNGTIIVGSSKQDVVIALGDNPYALTALKEAKKQKLKTILLSVTRNNELKQMADIYINPKTDEVAAPIATKFVLNTLTTASMALIGKVIGNKMVDVAVMNSKLVDRAIRIVSDFTKKSYDESEALLKSVQSFRKKQKQDPNRHVVPVAIVMAMTGLDPEKADELLIQNTGLVRQALKQYDQERSTMKERIIGNMTGNSMDAIDLVLTEFDGDKMTDICSFSQPYTKTMQAKMEALRAKVGNKTRAEILALPEFKAVHDEYVRQVAECVNAMCKKFKLDKKTIDAIGFHGKTLDHNPPSRAKADKTLPYTLQIGSGKMLADLTGIKVVYDFRSGPVMAGFDGAPLVPPHNAHIAATEGDGCYYNGGNTSNFAWVVNGVARVGADAGPFNEYVDNFIRENTKDSYDVDGKYGKKGKLNKALLQKLFDIGREFYERKLPKSGDPQFYHKDLVFKEIKKMKLSVPDAVYTLEYFAAYIAVQGMSLTDQSIPLTPQIVLFGGGWKNPVVRESFETLMSGKGYVLPEHKVAFFKFLKRFSTQPKIKYSNFGESMEARLFADLARYKLEDRAWEIPEIVKAKKKVICGVIATPKAGRKAYDDMINLAAKGWQKENARRQNKRRVK